MGCKRRRKEGVVGGVGGRGRGRAAGGVGGRGRVWWRGRCLGRVRNPLW